MLTARNVFEKLDGKKFSYPQLRLEVEKLYAENIDKLPAETRTRDLFMVATEKKWIKQNKDGEIVITLKPSQTVTRSGLYGVVRRAKKK